MRIFIIALFIIAVVGNADARSLKRPELIPGAPVEAELQNHGQYLNKSGELVHAPARSLSGATPDGATAMCGDGTFSFSHSRSGTCSRHGGVGKWLR